MMEQLDVTSALFQNLQRHYVALLGQRDVGIRTMLQDLVRGNAASPTIIFVPLALPLGMDDVEEFKQIVIDRLVVSTDSMLHDPALSQAQADILTRYSTQTADSRLRRVLDVLGHKAQAQQIVVILHTLNKVSTAPLKNLLLLLREYHDLIDIPGEAGYCLRFLVAGDEQLWRLCRHKDDPAISPFNIAKIVFIEGLSPLEIRTKSSVATDGEAHDVAALTSGVPLLIECYQRIIQERGDPHDPSQYFPYVMPTWTSLRQETQDALCGIIAGATSFPSTIPDYQSPQIPDVKGPWSDAFWGGFLRLRGNVLTWRSPIHEAFVRKMDAQKGAAHSAGATVEERIARLEQSLRSSESPLSHGQEASALARETGSDDLADLLSELRQRLPLADFMARIQRLASTSYARSTWTRTFCQIMTRWNDDPQLMLLVGIVLGAKRSIRSFDVFLCHNSQDKPSVLGTAERLVRAGVLPWLDSWEAPPGKQWQIVLEQDIERCKATAVFIGQSGVGPWQSLEIYAVLDDFTRRKRPIIPVCLRGGQNLSDVPLFLRSYTWVDFNREVPDPVQQMLDAIGHA